MSTYQPRSVDQIIEEQFRLWAESTRKNPEKKIAPLITISRQYGALGTTLGRHLAEHLGFTLWDQNLVHAIAENTGVSEGMVRSLDEQWPSTLNEIIANLVIGPKGTEAEYVRQIHRIVHTLEQGGSGVIIGRGAQFIVKSGNALKIRCVAPLALRVERVMKDEHMEKQEASTKVKKIDKERNQFHKRYFNHDVEDPCHYHLLVNTGLASLENCTATVLTLYRRLFSKNSA